MINSGCSHVAAHGTDSFYVVFRCVYAPHLHPFVCRWTCRLFPCLGYGTYCCYEHRGACVFELPFCLDIRPGPVFKIFIEGLFFGGGWFKIFLRFFDSSFLLYTTDCTARLFGLISTYLKPRKIFRRRIAD